MPLETGSEGFPNRDAGRCLKQHNIPSLLQNFSFSSRFDPVGLRSRGQNGMPSLEDLYNWFGYIESFSGIPCLMPSIGSRAVALKRRTLVAPRCPH
jgi:hypothetical protein